QIVAILDHLGRLAADGGDLTGAKSYYMRALAVEDQNQADPMDLIDILSDLADLENKTGAEGKAEAHYREALAIAKKFVPGSVREASNLAALADIKRRTQPTEAAEIYDETLTALENETARLGGSNDLRAGFRAKHESYYREYVDLLLSQHKVDDAFQVLERSRARTLLETLATNHIDIRKGADPDLLEKERALQASINFKSQQRSRLLSETQSQDVLKTVEKELSDLTTEHQNIEAELRFSSPAYSALTQPQPLSTREIQEQLLDPDTLLLEYSFGKDRSFVFALTPDSLQAFELPKRAEIERLARRV